MAPIRRGYPVYICKCGSMKFGNRTVTLDGVLDLIRWTTSGLPTALGEVGMDLATGRPRAFVNGAASPLGLRDESFIPSTVRSWVAQQNAQSTDISTIGITGVVSTGASSVLDTPTGQFIDYVSAPISGAAAGWFTASFTQTRMDYRPVIHMSIRTGSSLTNVRYWFGFFSASPASSDNPAISGMGFRYSTAVDGTAFWRTWTNDGTGGGLVTATTVPVIASTAYRFVIVVDAGGTSIRFYINDVLAATHAADLPGATTPLGPFQQVVTLEAVAKNVSISKISLVQRTS